jgi:hypothetical protein
LGNKPTIIRSKALAKEGNMRTCFIAALTGVLLLSIPAVAGTVTASDNKIAWKSTQCATPTPPESLLAADPHSHAEDMNTRVTQFNQYVGLMQSYMNCLSAEAQNDANSASQSIIKAGQDEIELAKANLDKLGAPLIAKK